MTDELKQYAYEHRHDFDRLVEFKSVSAKRSELPETAAWIADTFRDLGAQEVEKWTDFGEDNPVVFASFKGQNQDKTILFYNHYDVQPAEPFDEWKTEPFKVTEKDGFFYGRGISDDKGELMYRLTLLKYYKEHGGLPVNVKFFVEGEEEVGSLRTPKYAEKHSEQLSCDACVWEGGGYNNMDHYQVVGGLRGIISFDVEVTTADVDMHSSLASYAESAPWRLVKGLSSLRDTNGHILIDGFYDTVDKMSPEEEKLAEEQDFNLENAKKAAGLRRTVNDYNPLKELVNMPTISINGLSAGYQGTGVKTVIPRHASAKLDCRLSPHQDPEKMMQLVREQLVKNGFPDLEVHMNLGEPGYRANVNDEFVKLAMDEAKKYYGPETKYVLNSAGGGPADMVKTLGVPTLAIGCGYAGAKVHGPNENIRVKDYTDAVQYLGNLLNAYGK